MEKEFMEYNWHDCKIHAIGFDAEEFKFLLDIDLIFEWILSGNDKSYKFKVAPVTIVFKNVWDVSIDINTNLSLIIDTVTCDNPRTPINGKYIEDKIEYTWHIELMDGSISFNSTGFDMFIRQIPKIQKEQFYNLNERGGPSFELKTYI